MVDITLKHHKKYSNFFTPSECDTLISIVNRDKNQIPTGTYNETGYHGLTASYDRYNWLYHEDIKPFNIEKRLYDLPEFSDWNYMITQCWINELHVGQGLPKHNHGQELDDERLRGRYFYNANIFLGGEYTDTWYEDTDIVQNEIGDIHVFSCDLVHEVYENTGQDSRYSMAIDIYPFWDTNMTDTRRFKLSKVQQY